jgi:hypothetical protein
MTTRQTVHCDICGKRLDYTDVEGDVHVNGFTLKVAAPSTSSRSIYDYLDKARWIFFSYDRRTRCGHGGFAEQLTLPENICGVNCLRSWFQEFLSKVVARGGDMTPWTPPEEEVKVEEIEEDISSDKAS